MKRLIVIFIVLLCSTATKAQFSGGNGTENNPYIITTAEELAQLATYVNTGNEDFNACHYKLDNDIDLTEYLSETGDGYNDGKGWIPIGWYELSWINQPFSGVFDGDNHKILEIKADNATIKHTGLFGYISNATIKNLGVENINLNAGCVVGGIVGYCENNSNISHCYSTGSISNNFPPSSTYAGGVVGWILNSDISNCNSTCFINVNSSVPACVGGIVGDGSVSNILNCHSSALVNSISTSSSIAGGVVGQNSSGIVSNCSSTGSVINIGNSCYTGGVVGSNGYGSISHCFSTGRVEGSDNGSSLSTVYSGGVVGNSYADSDISNCYATGSVSGRGSYGFIGGIVGQSGPVVSNCMALNPNLTGIYSETSNFFGRIAGAGNNTSNNIAYEDMINPEGTTIWNNIGASNKDGESISCEDILADGTFGGRFTSEDGWTTQNGKLPGLFGNVIDLPEHLWCGYPIIITTTLANGTVDVAYSEILEATGDAPITWNIESGTLPTGLALNETSGVISGIPTVAGMFTFTVKATNAQGSDTKQLTILIYPDAAPPIIVTTTLANGTVHVAYSEILEATGDAPITWNIETGTLPTGLTLNETTGVISEIPTVAGTFTFTVKATNAVGSDTKQLSITVNEPSLITETEIESIKVYPNPTTGLLTICDMRNSHPLEGVRGGTIFDVEIFDVMGRMVMTVAPVETHGRASLQSQIEQSQIGQSKIGNRTSQIEINISHLPAGVYFVRIQTEQETVTKKVMKVNGN